MIRMLWNQRIKLASIPAHETEIFAWFESVIASSLNGEAASAASLMAPGARFFGSTDSALATFEAAKAAAGDATRSVEVLGLDLHELWMRALGDDAFLIAAVVTDHLRKNGKPLDNTRRLTIVCVREAGGPWRIAHSHTSSLQKNSNEHLPIVRRYRTEGHADTT